MHLCKVLAMELLSDRIRRRVRRWLRHCLVQKIMPGKDAFSAHDRWGRRAYGVVPAHCSSRNGLALPLGGVVPVRAASHRPPAMVRAETLLMTVA